MTNCHICSSDEEHNGGPKQSLHWWRTPREFDEYEHLKADHHPHSPLLTELERLAFLAAHGINDLRHKILTYKPGDFWLPIGGIQKQDLDIPPAITILLTGLTTSGKSSFINLLYAVLGRFGLTTFAQTSGESSSSSSSQFTTMYLEEHNVLRSTKSGFCVYDTRGLDKNHMEEGLNEVSTWMSEGVRHHQPCHPAGDDNIKGLAELNGSMELTSSRYITRKVNFVMVVADLSEIHRAFKCGDMKPLVALRALFHLPAIKNNSNGNPMLILTHGDTLRADERMHARVQICEYLGIVEMNGAYDIPCLAEQWILEEEPDPVREYAVTEAVYRGLVQSDRGHPTKWKMKEWMEYIFTWIIWCLASLFEYLARLLRKYAHHHRRRRHRDRDRDWDRDRDRDRHRM